ncbi:hypothetical protein SAMN04489761_4294 [Tenacibaculum sp. MAR_2009_124]|uniref:hypothetical protein n=1 Tax=Tenacibaculum sp. MAR_2009_124 TaxID=1250059 RepID=UPI000894E2FC|nr:hypothetical protein [Tenacibaculum sp. MAR_2009_124]SED10647.1 hypothetical protein SAMN04489761_4294 [Tenacibaculum sp. MAR_2009_124]
MDKSHSYRKEKLPSYVRKLKSMVALNYEVMTKEVDNVISEDKYHNIVKGRRQAAEQSIWGMKEVDRCYKEMDNLSEDELSSYYKKELPELIERLKTMCDFNLEVIDIELNPHEDDYNELLSVEKELKEMVGPDVTKAVMRAGKNISVTEDRLHNVIKSRQMAAIDFDWGISKIDELETELHSKEEAGQIKSWAKRTASKNKETR